MVWDSKWSFVTPSSWRWTMAAALELNGPADEDLSGWVKKHPTCER